MREALRNLVEAFRRKHEDREGGFTLIELMVVVLIIAILMAIAIPTYLSTRNSANNTAAEANLRNTMTAEQSVYSTDGQSYLPVVLSSGATGSTLPPEGNLSFQAAASGATAQASLNQVEVAVSGTGNELCMSDYSKSGKYFGIVAVAQTNSSYTAGDYYYEGSTATGGANSDPCQSGVPTSVSGSGWTTTPW